jgi:hypothetical protein
VTFTSATANANVTDLTVVTSARISEGASFTIPAGQVLGQVDGEAVTLSLKVNKAITLQDLSGGTTIKIAALSIDGDFATYSINAAKFAAGQYQLVASAGTRAGNYPVQINAQSVVNATGKAGVIDSASFTLAVTPVADPPIISVSRTVLNLSEDSSGSFEVVAYSPDATERVRVYLQLVDASGKLVTGAVAQNVALTLASNTGATLTPSASAPQRASSAASGGGIGGAHTHAAAAAALKGSSAGGLRSCSESAAASPAAPPPRGA